jgi:hypothetical protein
MTVDRHVHIKTLMMKNILINFVKNFVHNVTINFCFKGFLISVIYLVDTRGSDEDAILNDQILKILQGARLPLIEKDNELLIN